MLFLPRGFSSIFDYIRNDIFVPLERIIRVLKGKRMQEQQNKMGNPENGKMKQQKNEIPRFLYLAQIY